MKTIFYGLVSGATALRLAYFCAGFSPIGALCLAAFGLLPLPVGAALMVGPAFGAAVALAVPSPSLPARGWGLGILAVFVYDLICRLPFVAMGVWHDFIPKIGDHLLVREGVHWSVGYLWRYLGNGGGMGLAFFAVYPLALRIIGRRFHPVTLGIAYGIVIYCCLLATLFLSPHGQEYLFVPTPQTAYLGFLGHVVFGAVLGYGTLRMEKAGAIETLPDRGTAHHPASRALGIAAGAFRQAVRRAGRQALRQARPWKALARRP